MANGVTDTAKIAVVGGGIAGSTIALYLAETGLDVTLFEKNESLVSGPPMCHLHAGGNLYREISDEQCLTLLKESIELIRFYPDAIDYRPTVIAVPHDDRGTPHDLLARLRKLQAEYAALVAEDAGNKVLGEASEYFRLYERGQVEALKKRPDVTHPKNMDEWMIPVARNIDLETVKFPLLMVQEYGLNLFRLASSVTLSLEAKPNCRLLLKHKVTDIIKSADAQRWLVEYKVDGTKKHEAFDFLINAAGFLTGKLDDMLGLQRERFVEFKAAYVTRWEACDAVWPEVIFYGERGTPRGMGQFTPYPGGYFQLHGMTRSITLFDEGLVKSSGQSAQPQLARKFLDKIDKSWKPDEVKTRTRSAIDHLAHFIPSFKNAQVVSKPLYGAQQIPGDDATLRAANVSFDGERYARCEIVKASSVLTMADTITRRLIALGYVNENAYGKRDFAAMRTLDETQISRHAKSLCERREYPVCLSKRAVGQH